MPTLSIKTISLLGLAILLAGCDNAPKTSTQIPTTKEVKPMEPVTFTCALEKDHNPALDPEGENYFQQARALEKTPGIRNWPLIIEYYEKAIEKDHWKAMNNLAGLYRSGKRSVDGRPGIEADRSKELNLYLRMVKLEVPMGYYNFAVAIGRGAVPNTQSSDAGIFMLKAANAGYPLAQVALGNHYSFGLPRAQQRDDIADLYFKCAGQQDNTEALLEVASFYKIAKENKPLALYYYQKAASLGSETGFLYLTMALKKNPSNLYNFGYEPEIELVKKFEEMYSALERDSDLRFPNLMKDYPLPRHPIQGYDADNPDVRPDF